jgi:hypothetical protein
MEIVNLWLNLKRIYPDKLKSVIKNIPHYENNKVTLPVYKKNKVILRVFILTAFDRQGIALQFMGAAIVTVCDCCSDIPCSVAVESHLWRSVKHI